MAAPRLPRLITGILLNASEREFILGDLDELHTVWSERHGERAAGRRYWRAALGSIVSRAVSPTPARVPRKRRSSMAGEILHDIRSAVRTLVREPGFVAIVVLTLGIGVGATGAVFGMMNQLILRPLPGVTNGSTAGYLQFTDPESEYRTGVSQPVFEELRRSARLLTGMASYSLAGFNAAVDEDSRPVTVRAQLVYGDFFETLGVRPAEGRLLRAAETGQTAAPPAAVISEEFRARIFGPGAPAAGRVLLLDNKPVRVIGVAGGSFSGPERGDAIDLWLPYGSLVSLFGRDPEWMVHPASERHQDILVGLPPDLSVAAAEAQITALLQSLAPQDPERAEFLGRLETGILRGLSVPPTLRERTHGALKVLAMIVAAVLIIACANVANILLIRNVSRRGAIATRRALGASTGRIARQNIIENSVLAVVGAAVGLAVAWCITLPFRGEHLLQMPAFEAFTIDTRVLFFAAVVAMASVLIFGTIPAALAGRFDLAGTLRDASGRETGRLAVVRSLLSAGQIALSLALLIGGVLLTRTVYNLYAVDTGFDIEDVWAISLSPPPQTAGAELATFQRQLIAAAERVPGVESAAIDFHGPHTFARFMGGIGLPDGDQDPVRTAAMPVTPGWFELYDIETVSGRTFTRDDWHAEGGVVLTAALARRLFGTEDAVGRRVVTSIGGERTRAVTGVVRDLRMVRAPDEPIEVFFVPFWDLPFPFMLQVRVRDSDATAVAAMQAVVGRAVPGQPLPEAVPVTDRVHAAHSEQRVFGRMLMLLSSLTLVMAGIGLYGVVAFAVTGRRQEFGIRVALGAGGQRIASLVLRYAGSIILLGTLAGLWGAYLLSRVLQNRLYEVAPVDPVSYAVAIAALAVVAAIACAVPTWKAVRVNPIDTLQGR